jgi:hypothetical protein
MGVTDHTKHFDGLDTAAPPVQVPNAVSRYIKVGERSFAQVISEAGKGVTDSELNLHRDVDWWASQLFQRWQVQSGWLRGQTRQNGYDDYTTVTAPGGLVDDSVIGTLIDGTTLVNSFVLPRLEASVAGFPVVVEYTNTRTPEYNLVELEAPTPYDGNPTSIKRTDFVFLEVWLSLVAPSVSATSTLTVGDSSQIVAGDTIDIAALPALTAVAGARTPGADDFQIFPGSNTAQATEIAAAINDPLNSFATTVTASPLLTQVILTAVVPGVVGNLLTLGVTVVNPGSMTPFPAVFFSGGADRPNKPSQTQVYQHGNVLAPSQRWLDDEIIDPTLGYETAQRVQVQYRIRSTGAAEGINLKTNPDGFSTTPNLTAWAGAAAPVANYPFVPANNSTIWLSSDATAYGQVDSGLWVAGNGSEPAAQALGTLDGYVYAIPLCFVFRHNDAGPLATGTLGFDPVNNTNGGPLHDHAGYVGVIDTIPAGLSDRPDNEFADVITQNNLLDLRRHVLFSGADLGGELQYQLQSLLDGSTRTWAIDTASKQTMGSGSGEVSTRSLICDEIGRAGTSNRGEYIRHFDHVARRFGDQSVVERVVIAFYPGDRTAGAVPPGTSNSGKYVVKAGSPNPGWDTSWYEGDILNLDLTAFNASTLGGIFQGLDGGGSSGGGTVSAYMPAGTVISDVLSVYHDDGNYNVGVPQTVAPALIQGLGTRHLEITLDANDTAFTGGQNVAAYRAAGSGGTADGSPRRIFVEVEITYPLGQGVTNTPDFEVTPDATVYPGGATSVGNGPGAVIEVDTLQRPTDFEGLLEPRFREGYREVQLDHRTNDSTVIGVPNVGAPVGSITPEQIVSRDPTTLYFPRRVEGTPTTTSVTDATTAGALTVDEPNCEFGSSSRKVVLLGGTPLAGAGQTLADIEYFPQDPIPNFGGAGYQVAVYYRSNAPQTAGVKEGNLDTSGSDGTMPQTLQVEPLVVGTDVWTGQVGMGSVDLAYPYVAPLDQVVVNDGLISSTEEWFFAATASTTIDDFDAETGLLALHAFVQTDGQGPLTLGGPAPTEVPRTDQEFRSYYPFADDTAYRPSAMSQPMYGAVRHKVFVPMLVRALEDVPNAANGLLYRKDELLLVVVSRFAELDEENTVRFVDTDNRTAAAVYRSRNLLLVAGR